MTSSVDAKLHSAAPLVVVEAAAGCGKTTKAAEYACQAAERLKHGKVLLLSHTHAACGEFHRKCGSQSNRRKIDVETCDSFCLKAIAAYGQPLGLPTPLDGHLGRAANGVQFGDLSKKAAELFRRSPTIARTVAAHYPIIILDEHQDASLSQHESVILLRDLGGSQLRIFGDSMQAIHVKDKEAYVDFHRLWLEADEKDRLDKPHRWSDSPELGEWIQDCRRRLMSGNAIRLRNAPTSVSVSSHAGLAGRKKFIDPKSAGKIVRTFLDQSSKPAVILAFSGDMARSVAEVSSWRADINEGAQLDNLDELIEAFDVHAGCARGLSTAFLEFLGVIGVGLPGDFRSSLGARLGATVNVKGVGAKQQVWLDHLQPIYSSPDHRGMAAAMRAIRATPPAGYTIRLRDHSWALCSFERTDDPRAFRSTLGRIRRQRKSISQMVSTIHKAKGLDFDNVLLCPIDQHQYPKDELGARLLYVALSRARKTIRLALETKTPTVHVAIV